MLAIELLSTPQADGTFTIMLCGMVLLVIANIVLLVLLRRKGSSDSEGRETMLYRLAQLEARLRSLEEQGRQTNYTLRELQAEWETRSKEPAIELSVAPPEPTLPSLSPQVDEILKRHKRGQSVLAIAQEMGLGQGEVQLVIALEDSIRAVR